MKKVSSVFQLLVALFFGVALVFFLVFDSIKNGFGIQELTAGKVVIWLLAGFVLYLITWLLVSMYSSSMGKKIRKLEAENDKLKARLYDHEQKAKVSPMKGTAPPTSGSGPEDDTDGSGIKPRQNIK
ncbi:hypothetical protein [Echinicola vietnamensis]|uniref:Lipopolysaccharide assembly protein A domain-containing protein n=1 Tax=Echinicola vietnamensis (strain DSM 17526 / LMG 23754 / KMM 6221) TaxID=926556 RepID=L0FZ48_ECHVK|nr:hypothetical protein [Echinicola vietnamensis]AGA78001.1 hypothetical protein Echvi_1736 [Echinicola vietnamensis DSM 17526]